MAVVQPNEMEFTNKNFATIIAGSPGIGKTTLALSAPDPVLIDFDNGISRVKAKHRKTTIVCSTYEEVLNDLQSPEVKAAQTLVIDTGGSLITFLQDWAMRSNPAVNTQKNGAISLKGFGAVKAEFVSLTNRLLHTMKKNVIYIFHTTEEKDGDKTKQRLLCEGAARNIVWQPCDLGGYMQMIGNDRVIGFSPTEEYFAKGSFGISGTIKLPELTDDTPNDFMTRLFEKARANITAEAEIYAQENAAYDAVMKKGTAIIEGIKTVKSAESATQKIKALEHVLTSERELKEAFKAKLKGLGIKWSKEQGKYVADKK